jgi:hypothetical protein
VPVERVSLSHRPAIVEHVFDALASAIDGLTISTTEELAGVLALAERLHATLSAAVDTVERAGLHQTDGSVSMTSWLVLHGRMSRASAAALAGRARRLHHLPAVQDAWVNGTLSGDQAKAIAQGIHRSVTDLFGHAFADLLPVLAPLAVDDVARVVHRWNSYATAAAGQDEGGPPAEPSGFHLDRTLDGTWRGALTLSADDAETVTTALERAMDTTPPAEGEPVRTRAQRRADALAELCRFFLDHHRPDAGPRRQRRSSRRRTRPHLNLLATVTDATTPGGAGRSLVTGQPIDTPWLREVACDCTLHRVLAGTAGEILDYGRSQRVVPPALFHAIVVRDQHCRYPGCDRPPDWCDAHHLVHWLDHGATSLGNCTLLCRRHHRRLHQPGHRARLDPDGTLTITTPTGTVLTSAPPLRLLVAPTEVGAGP